ncbi:glutamate--tRNA ligase [Halobacteriales archaeon SW_8_65_20]|nr:MAG: glutamate--tRNA ligase [Halobacteriales archaeon SW_8_65_20]
MDEQLREQIEHAAERAALFNALKHDSDAQVGAIMGPLLGENPDFREHGDRIPGVIAPVIERVNGLDESEKRDRLGELDPEAVEALASEDEGDEHALPELSNTDGGVKMRAAPNPNGPWHIGHARMPAVIGTYAERYDGEFIVRFDDTDPETKRPDLDAYDAILEDIEYLGFEPSEVYRASDRLDIYYEHARELIDAGGAYTCTCPQDEFSELKNGGEACPHRGKDRSTVHEEFDAMVDGEYESGDIVLRVRTDIEHKNPALRDFVAFRMIDTPHPREAAAAYRCWPMLDFQSGIDDHLTGVTHIIRGIDLQDSAKKQRFVYDYFGWEYPEVVHWGHVQVDEYDVTLSTSTLKAKIEAGEYDGWDDPRVPTIKSLRRRGIRGQAIVDAMVELGTSTSDVDLPMSNVYAHNRELVDDETDRAFAVREGVRFEIAGGPDAAHPPVHPDFEERGEREIPVGDSVMLEPDDVPEVGERVWLKGFGPFGREGDTLVYTDESIDIVRETGVPVVHWVPTDGSVSVRLRTIDGDVACFGEPGIESYEPGERLQFERIGFVRVDEQTDRETTVYFTHE